MKFPTFEQVTDGNLYFMSNHSYIGYTYRHEILNNFFIQIQCINNTLTSRCDIIEFSLCNKAGIPIWSGLYDCNKESYEYGCNSLMMIMLNITKIFNDIIAENVG